MNASGFLRHLALILGLIRQCNRVADFSGGTHGLVWALTCCVAALAIGAYPAGAQDSVAAVPLTLWQLLDGAATGHPLVEAARSRVQAARGSRVTAGAFGNPMLSYDVENARLPGSARPLMERETMLMATFPLEPLYQRAPRVSRADAEIKAAEADAAAERQTVLLAASRAFYAAALAQVELEAARDLGRWLDTIVAYNAIRVEEGVTAEADLLRSRLERDRASANVALREAELARARANVGAFLGDASFAFSGRSVAIGDAPMPMPPVVLTTSTDPTAPIEIAPGVMSRSADTTRRPFVNAALTGRAEIKAARERLAAASAGIVSERRMRVRDLGATVGTKRSEGSTSLLAGLSLPFPMFDQNRGEILRATAERDAAAFELAATERAVRAEVLGAFEAARILTERIEPLARGGPNGLLARADEARRIALGAYREGAIPLIHVIDAARAWGEARLAFYQTLFSQHESVLALLASQGRDLVAALPPRGTGPTR